PSTSVIGPGAPIPIPPGTSRVDHEAELGVVIGRHTSRVRADDALRHVLGYTVVNDVTARDMQRSDGVFARAKGFDGFCPLGPWIRTDLDPGDLAVRAWVDGELRQDGRTSDMVFGVAELIAFISGVMTLRPGDVIATGT
ncbi:MAG: fumarylacetoacetate hydrolase family protein, partial [bacterium]